MHTPGPWKVDATGSEAAGWAFRIVGDANYAPLARINGVGPTSAANARLIAAAPKLLEALEALLEDINHTRIPGIADSNNIERSSGWARIVIAEAKGE